MFARATECQLRGRPDAEREGAGRATTGDQFRAREACSASLNAIETSMATAMYLGERIPN